MRVLVLRSHLHCFIGHLTHLVSLLSLIGSRQQLFLFCHICASICLSRYTHTHTYYCLIYAIKLYSLCILDGMNIYIYFFSMSIQKSSAYLVDTHTMFYSRTLPFIWSQHIISLYNILVQFVTVNRSLEGVCDFGFISQNHTLKDQCWHSFPGATHQRAGFSFKSHQCSPFRS